MTSSTSFILFASVNISSSKKEELSWLVIPRRRGRQGFKSWLHVKQLYHKHTCDGVLEDEHFCWGLLCVSGYSSQAERRARMQGRKITSREPRQGKESGAPRTGSIFNADWNVASSLSLAVKYTNQSHWSNSKRQPIWPWYCSGIGLRASLGIKVGQHYGSGWSRSAAQYRAPPARGRRARPPDI